jgi:hypothetical protein
VQDYLVGGDAGVIGLTPDHLGCGRHYGSFGRGGLGVFGLLVLITENIGDGGILRLRRIRRRVGLLLVVLFAGGKAEEQAYAEYGGKESCNLILHTVIPLCAKSGFFCLIY